MVNKMKMSYNVITDYLYCTHQLKEDLVNDYVMRNVS